MQWTEQTEAMVKALTEAQKQLWKNWSNWPGVLSPTPGSSGAANQGYESAAEGVTSSADGEQVAKGVAKRLLASQDQMLRFLELSLRAWKAITPTSESGKDPQTALRSFAESLRQQFLQFPQEIQKAVQDTGELWRLYNEQWKGLAQPWATSLQQTPWNFGQASTGDGSALMELQKLYWDAHERTFGRMLEGPSLGITREMNEDILKGFDAWLDYRQASFEYQVSLAETWSQAFEEFMRRLLTLAEKGETVPSVKALLLLWIEIVDQVFSDVFRSAEYIRIQGRLVNTAAVYRLREREIVDAFLKASHLASRSELDEAYKRIYELRKSVKELKKAVQVLNGERSAKAPEEAQAENPTDLPKATA